MKTVARLLRMTAAGGIQEAGRAAQRPSPSLHRLARAGALSLAGLAVLAAGPAAATSLTRTSSFEYSTTTGMLTKEIIEPGSSSFELVTTYTRDGFGNVTASTVNSPVTGAAAIASRTTTTTFDANGRFATGSENALGHDETRVFDARFGGPTSLTGPNGLTTTWEYDGFGRKTREKRADGTETVWQYAFCNGVAGGSAPNCPALAKYVVTQTPHATAGGGGTGAAIGAYVKAYFDMLNREVRSETEAFNGSDKIYVDTVYDANGRVQKKSRPYSSGTPVYIQFEYDILGRVTKEIQPDGSDTVHAYAGLTTTATNDLGQVRSTTKNSQGQVVTVTDHLGGTNTYTYDPFGNLLTTTDAAGNVTTLTYDLRGRKTAMNDPNMGAWSYVYDVLGQMIEQTDAKSQVTSFVYDKLGRMTQRTDDNGLVSSWEYDTAANGIGKLAEVGDSNGYARVHTYDAQGRPASSTVTIDGDDYTTTTSYNAQGRVSRIDYPSGTFGVEHVYTALGYLKEVRKANGSGTGALYWQADTVAADGQLTSFTYGNLVQTTQTYDANTGRISTIQAGASASVQNQAFVFDTIGNLSSRSDDFSHNSLSYAIDETFTYDGLNRLTGSSLVYNGASPVVKAVDYNAIGNITFKTGVGIYSYPASGSGSVRPNAVSSTLISSVTTSYLYDANGNMTTKNGNALTWTPFNMPATIAEGVNTLAFTYDPERQRISQTPSVSGTPGDKTLYINDPASGLKVELVKGASSTRWSNFVYATGGMVAVFYEDSTPANNATRYFHKDHLGSISVVTNELGAVVDRYSYDAWGKRRELNGADDPSNLLGLSDQTTRGFTGHEMLTKVALVHMNGRVYDPNLGRFLSADPIIQDPLNTQSLNRYTYVLNNPLCYTDPSGFFFKSIMKFFQKNPILAVVVGVATAWATGGFTLAALKTFESAVIAGAVTGGLTGGLKGAVLGGISGAITFGIGDLGMNFLGDAAFAGRAVLHGVAQGTFAEIQGGSFGAAFLSASFSSAAMHGLGRAFPGSAVESVAAKTVAAAVIGGTASVIGGGKFQNGAATAAFIYLFNHLAHEISAAAARERYEPITSYGEGIDIDANANEARRLGRNFDVAGFVDRVDTGKAWDYKSYPTLQIAEAGGKWAAGLLEEFGNYHFGYVAQAFGFPLGFSLAGAGNNQYWRQGGGSFVGAIAGGVMAQHPTSLIPRALTNMGFNWGDKPYDSMAIMNGWLHGRGR